MNPKQKPKSKSRRELGLLRRLLGWFAMDRLWSLWGFLSEHVLDHIGRFFHCFGIVDEPRSARRTSPVQDWGYFPSDYFATPFLRGRGRDECGYVVDLESGGLVGADRYEATDEEVVDLVDQAELLKAWGTLSQSPDELKKHRMSPKAAMSNINMDASSDNGSATAGASSSYRDQPLHQETLFPVEIGVELPKKIMEENERSSLLCKPALTAASDVDLSSEFKNLFAEKTVSPTTHKCQHAVNLPDEATEPPDRLQSEEAELSMKEKSVSPIEGQSASSDHVVESSTPRELETCERRASQIRSVRFEFDESPASDPSSGSYRSESSQYGSPGKGNNYQLSGRGHSPYPTPLILSNEMQTPGTVYVSAKMQGCAVAGKITKVRSQYVYPVEEFTQWNALKET